MSNSLSARLYITLVALAGAATLAIGLAHGGFSDAGRFTALLVVATIAHSSAV